MVERDDARSPMPVSAVLCVGRSAMRRFGRIVRHLVVGLVDQAVNVRVVSDDQRSDFLALGPVQTHRHDPLRWPLVRRRLERLIDELEPQPPGVIHALSSESYFLAHSLAAAFDADLVVHVTSLEDCERLSRLPHPRDLHCIATSEPLARELAARVNLGAGLVEVVRPGILASSEPAFGSNPGQLPTLVCTSAMDQVPHLELLIESLSLLKQRGRQVLAFFLNEGREETALRRMVRSKGLSPSVTFSHPSGDITAALQSADIFVWPQADDAFFMDTLAAMAEGLAVVSMPSRVCDHLLDNETVCLCRGSSTEALTDSLDQILTNKEYALQLANNGQKYVRQHHAVSAMAERIASTYRRLVLPRTTFTLAE